MASRYITGTSTPRPVMRINPAPTDILHTLKHGERIDNLSFRFYNDPNLSWIIMCANREYQNEFEIPFGTVIRIPLPLSRIYANWQISSDL